MPEETRQTRFTQEEVRDALAAAVGYPPESSVVEYEWETTDEDDKLHLSGAVLKCTEKVARKIGVVVQPPRTVIPQIPVTEEQAAAAGLEPESISGVCPECGVAGTVDVAPAAVSTTPVWCPRCSAKMTLVEYTAQARTAPVQKQTQMKRKSRRQEIEDEALEQQMDALGL